MDGLKRLWSRRLAVAVSLASAALTTMGVSQCGSTTSSTITVSGSSLAIYASAAPGTQQDVIDAEQLALKQAGAKVGNFTIRFDVLDRTPSDNARTAIQDTSAIAYLGENEPGMSASSMGINEDQDLLQVSPTDTAIALTQSTPAVRGAPKNYYEQYSTYHRTFARVVPSGVAEAQAQVTEMHALGVTKVFVADDGSDYGKAAAYAVEHAASSAGLSAVAGSATASAFSASGADALFYGGMADATARAAALFEQVGSKAKLFVPSALDSSALASALGSAKLDLYASQPGFLTKDLPASAQSEFVKPFEAAYGHLPDTEAIFGYEAMSAVLAVLHQAGTQANNRSTVVHDFFKLTDRHSVLGTYSIDPDGDTSIAPFVFSRLRAGILQPFKFVQASP
jgi:branched-chain amino acid transport system substrate-binding protein